MPGGSQLSKRIEEALSESGSLVVICSPASAQSAWVNREAEFYLGLGRLDRILPVIAWSCTASANLDGDFFPPALRGRGLLAIDLREIRTPPGNIVGDGRDGGRLKLLAGLLGVGLDQLAQRERRRQRVTIAALSTTAAVFAVIAAIAVWQRIIRPIVPYHQSAAGSVDQRTAAFDLVPARTEFESNKGHVSKILILLVHFVAGLPGHVSNPVRCTGATVSALA